MTEAVQKTKGAQFGVNIGYVIKTNNVIGLIAGYAPGSNNGVKIRGKEIGIFYRGYKPLGNKFYFFGQADAKYAHSGYASGNRPLNFNNEANSVGLSFTPGISYEVLNKMHIELTLPNIFGIGRTESKISNNNEISSSSKSFSANTSLNGNTLNNLNLGFKLFF